MKRRTLPVRSRKEYELTGYERIAIGADSKNYKKCAQCGKEFYCEAKFQGNYTYKISKYGTTKYFCSWSWMRKYESEVNRNGKNI